MKTIPIYSHRARLFQTHKRYEEQLHNLSWHMYSRRYRVAGMRRDLLSNRTMEIQYGISN